MRKALLILFYVCLATLASGQNFRTEILTACLEMFHQPQMHLFNGQLTVLVESSDNPGDIIVEINSPGVKKGTCKIVTKFAVE